LDQRSRPDNGVVRLVSGNRRSSPPGDRIEDKNRMAAPAISGLDDVTFLENTVNTTPQIIDSSVSFSDADEDFNTGTLTVSGVLAEDTISIHSVGNNPGEISYNSGTGEVSYGGVVFGIVTGGVGADLTIVFDADATSAAIQALIENLTYANSSDAPTAVRTLTINVTDAAANSLVGDGAVQITVTAETDTFTGDGGANVVSGSAGNDILNGLGGDDTLIGGGGNDRLRGGTGADTMQGGTGDDIYVVDNALDTTDETGGDGTDTVATTISWTLTTGTENLTLAGVGGAIDGTGNTADNLITGNASANILSGLDGNDTINADGGNDTVSGGDGSDTLNGEVGDDTLNGDAGTDTLNGGNGADTLDGGLGADGMTGGLGNDIFYVDDVGDTVNENLGEGNDEVRAAITYGLGGNVENLTLTGGGDIDGTGNALRNVITGNTGANTIHAGAEVDTVSGGDGNDTIYGEAGNDVLNGDNGADLLDGGDGDDTLVGGAGADYLRGGVGADRMSGGTGNDYYVVDSVGDTTDETGGDGVDSVISRVTWTLRDGTENLTLAAPGGAINGTGNAADNVIVGNSSANLLWGLDGNDNINGDGGNDTLRGGNGADTLDGSVGNDTLYGDAGIDSLIGGWGNDILDGGTGADSMAGGLGNDIYYVDDAGDTITEGAGEGTDAVESSVSYTLAANVENLTLLLLAGNIDGTGSNVRNTIIGTRGDNVLHGMGDLDTLYGGNGADTLYGDDGNDVLYGENDNDTLYGGNGEDTLTGGGGSDRFVFTDLDVHRTGLGQSANKDKILDLNFNQGDRIDLSAIDANVLVDNDQAFTFVSKFTHVAGQAVLTFSGGVTALQLDVDGDGYADLRVEITGNHTATTTNLYTGPGDTNGGWVL
jgi:Ca2+-binding RTX toxin-like protein